METAQQVPATKERRSVARRQPALGTVCRLGDFGGFGLVWNISPGGVSMLLHDQLEPGATIRAELASAEQGYVLPVTLRVAHVAQLRTGDYMVGGQFDRTLSAEEIRPFLGGNGART
jgi:hypothetical protein